MIMFDYSFTSVISVAGLRGNAGGDETRISHNRRVLVKRKFLIFCLDQICAVKML